MDLLYSPTFWFTLLVGCIALYLWFRSKRQVENGSSTASKRSSVCSHAEDVMTELPNDLRRYARTRDRDRMSLGRKVKKMVGIDSNGGSPSEGSPTRRSHRKRRYSSGPINFARRLIQGRQRLKRQLSAGANRLLPKPPSEFFEPSLPIEIPHHLSPELFYVLHHLKVLEPPADWRLSPGDIQTRIFEKDEYVFKPNDSDIYVYVLLEGCMAINIMDAGSSKEYEINQMREGDSVFSMLSLLDVVCGNESVFRTVSGKCTQRSLIAMYNMNAFRTAFLKDPHAWVRSIQIIITGLLHVTLTTLHHYLGLSSELTKITLLPIASAPLPISYENDRQRQASGGLRGVKHSESVGSETNVFRRRRLSSEDANMHYSPYSTSKTTGTFRCRHISDIHSQERTAKKRLAEALQLTSEQDYSLLDGRFEVVNYAENTVVVEQGSKDKSVLLLVLHGSLKLTQLVTTDKEPEEIMTGIVFCQELVGGLQVLSGEPSFYTIKTRCACKVAQMTSKHFLELMEAKPNVILPVCSSVLRRLSPFLRGIDFALSWQVVESGHALYKQGERADCLHVVLSGRLRSVLKQNEKKEVVEEYGRGDMVGMLEVLMRKPRATTVLAVRFTQLAKVPSGLLDYIKVKYPQVGFRMIQLLGHYYTTNQRRVSGTSHVDHGKAFNAVRNLHTVAILPANKNVPLVPFTCELYHALSTNTSVLRLSSKLVAEHLEPAVLEQARDFRLIHWLNTQEDIYPLVIYECDFEFTAWTRRCVRQADAILVVANGEDDPSDGMSEEQKFEINAIRTNKELVLLWREDTDHPRGTYEWLKARGWFSGHYHVRAPNRMYQWPKTQEDTAPEDDVVSYYETNVYPNLVDNFSDFARIARILTGNSVGLVLGGGGARGASHIGIIQAMKEAGVPIDIVAGVSMGAFIGAIYCDYPDANTVPARAKPWFDTLNSVWAKLFDLTYHHSAIFTGAGFNRSLQQVFGDKEIEDLWIPFSCITTDISTSEMRVHKSGPVWAYCRASMSLAGYLPPLCDPSDGHLLLDGGYVNNLPADVMHSMGVSYVVAVDVGSNDESNLTNYGDCLNGFWVLWQRWNPWAEPVRVLDMQEIQSRLAYVSCVRQLEQVKKAPYCQYIRPPVDPFKTLDFGKFDLISKLGFDHGKVVFEELLETEEKWQAVINPERRKIFKSRGEKRHQAKMPDWGKTLASTTSFVDLAAAVSKLPNATRAFNELDNYPSDLDDLPDVWDEDTEEEIEEDGLRFRSPTPTPNGNVLQNGVSKSPL